MSYNTSQYYEVLAMSLRLGDTAPNLNNNPVKERLIFMSF